MILAGALTAVHQRNSLNSIKQGCEKQRGTRTVSKNVRKGVPKVFVLVGTVFESRLAKGNRSIEILDGYEDVVEQEFTSFVSRLIGNRLRPSGALARSLKPKACVSMGAE